MKKTLLLLIFFCNTLNVCIAQNYAITDVSVIPMNREQILSHQTVIIQNGVIVQIGEFGKIKIPKKTTIIEGKGKYLIPGLMDMHVHTFTDNGFPIEYMDDELKINLANGITTVRIMSGNEHYLKLREESRKNPGILPDLFVASPEIAGHKFYKDFHGWTAQTAEEGEKLVREAKKKNYDFVKITFYVPVIAYETIIKTAKELNIPVIGHLSNYIQLDRGIKAGQQIEHLDEYMEAMLKSDAPDTLSLSGQSVWMPKRWNTVDYLDEDKIDILVAQTKAHNIYNTPTSAFLHKAFGTGMTDEEIANFPDLRFIPQNELEDMKQVRKYYLDKVMPEKAKRDKFISIRNMLVKKLYDADCKLMAGSDTPSWFMTYGFTLHRELEYFVLAGLSPYAALQTATTNTAEFLGIAAKRGTIEKGKDADIVLLEANPLENITNTTKVAGVMNKGVWYSKKDINLMLDEIAKLFK